MPSIEAITLSDQIRQSLAGFALSEKQARLYSQRLHLDMGQPGLPSFTPHEVESNLEDALTLIQCSLIVRNALPQSDWRSSLKRAGELLEWLSQKVMRNPGDPLHLLSAAAFQLAGYPAMSLGVLRRSTADDTASVVLKEFLRANFPAALHAIQQYWTEEHRRLESTGGDELDLSVHATRHVLMCIGTVCTELRTGESTKTERALEKLEKLAQGYLHSRDHFSYFLARLTAAAARVYVSTALWPAITSLEQTSTPAAAEALRQFARSSFVNRRLLVWPGQKVGIEHLAGGKSFVLCTPTGSGKTTVATLAVVQGLFAEQPEQGFADIEMPGNLILYLVPSRALAAEVEARLKQDLSGLAAQSVVVTGLYGGIDWGPTDAWIESESATILVCTYEKADALIRYLGVLFLKRVTVVVIDEAHMVEQPPDLTIANESGASRHLRLEQLGSRLFRARDQYGFRIIALSAVAANAAPAMARWVAGDVNAQPAASDHRSTRQMLGRLEVSPKGEFIIRYDLMDGLSLRFQEEDESRTPYVRSPMPALPGGLGDEGPDVQMRAPTVWAALHLAAEQVDGQRPSVLISLTQNVETFALDSLKLVEKWGSEGLLPSYTAVTESDDAWKRCLASAADYFSEASTEYRLLRVGIAIHHGKMPNLLARRIKLMIDRGQLRVIIATSTLSEGVNLPVNFLLMPSMHRGQNPFTLQEFTNLIGRAGRPGVATEGSALVVLPGDAHLRSVGAPYNRHRTAYNELIAEIEQLATTKTQSVQDKNSSGLALLLDGIHDTWKIIAGQASQEEFWNWLEQTAVPTTLDEDDILDPSLVLLDNLDAFLIAAIQEVEELRGQDLPHAALESELISVWRRTYAFASAAQVDRLSKIWLTRGNAIKQLYPDPVRRRQVYRSSLSPRSAANLLDMQAPLKAKLISGAEYAAWTTEQRFTFVVDILALLAKVPAFSISTKLGRGKNFTDWPTLLRWWLAKSTLKKQPKVGDITKWFKFVSENFIFRSTWGLGSIIGLLLDLEDEDGPVKALEMEDWPRSGLPWIAFWLKELITWGTLDPVAAFLLARADTIDRPTAEAEAKAYYASVEPDVDSNGILDPRRISRWTQSRGSSTHPHQFSPAFAIPVQLAQPGNVYLDTTLSVTPLSDGMGVTWIDPAGYIVARSGLQQPLPASPSSFEFNLDVHTAQINCRRYQQHVSEF